MRKITINTPGGREFIGHLPDALNWDEVPLSTYAAIVAAQQPERTNVRALTEAVALLTGLSLEPMLEDASLLAFIIQEAPWLFGGHLPPSGEPVPVFTHAGITYAHVGNFDKISAGQLEALYDFLQANEGGPVNCAPNLLAVLYCPQGQQQTAEVVRDAAAAFGSLPLSIAWPAITDFIRSSMPCATNILTASAISAQVEKLVTALEMATTGGSDTFWRRPVNWLVKIWIRNVRKML